jgi:UDP:flavonoid glycosyltransferase YjiC (YdhE family)
MRVLAAVWDGSGNLPPLLGLIEALHARGHSVRVLAHRSQWARLQAIGAGVTPYLHAGEFDIAAPQFRDGEHIGQWLTRFDEAAVFDLTAAVKSISPDVILVDCMLPATLTAARGLIAPAVSYVHSAWGAFQTFGEYFRTPTETCRLALVFSHQAFDTAADRAPFLWVGPARGPALPGEWGRGRPDLPLVLASLSAGQQGQGPTLSRLADALRSVKAESLLTTGRGYDPSVIPGGPTLTVMALAPHEQVLKSADLLVTHGGHGTVMAGLVSGTPMLCLPGVGDQPYNSQRVVALGLGETLSPQATSEEMAAAIVRILSDGAMRARAQAFATTFAAHPSLEAGLARLEALV